MLQTSQPPATTADWSVSCREAEQRDSFEEANCGAEIAAEGRAFLRSLADTPEKLAALDRCEASHRLASATRSRRDRARLRQLVPVKDEKGGDVASPQAEAGSGSADRFE